MRQTALFGGEKTGPLWDLFFVCITVWVVCLFFCCFLLLVFVCFVFSFMDKSAVCWRFWNTYLHRIYELYV